MFFIAEDARTSVVLRPGMIFRPKMTLPGEIVDGKIYLIVSNLKWGILVWPMINCGDQSVLQPMPEASLEWFFCSDSRPHDSAVYTPMLSDVGLHVMVSEWEPCVKGMLRSFSLDLTFPDLQMVAKQVLGIPESLRSRADVINRLCEEVAPGDSEFLQEVQTQEEKKKRKNKKQDSQQQDDDNDSEDDEDESEADSLCELLLENMDANQVDDFKYIKKRVQERHARNQKRKWSRYAQEDKDATLLFSFYLIILFDGLQVSN